MNKHKVCALAYLAGFLNSDYHTAGPVLSASFLVTHLILRTAPRRGTLKHRGFPHLAKGTQLGGGEGRIRTPSLARTSILLTTLLIGLTGILWHIF